MTKMTTEEAFVKVLQAHGIEHAFGIIGSAFMPISDLFPKAGITFWDVAHETNGGLIADGYTRSTGKMSMVIAQNGPGITGLVTPIKTAYWNHTPLLLVTPQAANKTMGQGGFQEVEQMNLFKDMVCYQEEVRDPSRMAEVLNRVIEKAIRGSAPAQINIPRDYWPKNANIIQVDINSDRIGLTKKVTVGICGDAKLVALQLLNKLSPKAGEIDRQKRKDLIHKTKSAWLQKLTSLDHEEDDKGTVWNKEARERDKDRMSPRQAWRAIQAGMPENVIISSDIGNNCAIGNAYPTFEKGRKYLAPGLFGPCGYGFPSILGAKIGCPDTPVIGFAGDGAFGISMSEMSSCARKEWPNITMVIFRNYQWGAEKRNSILWFDDNFVGTELDPDLSYAKVANACGLKGVAVKTMEETTKAIKQSCEDQSKGITTFIEIILNQELGEPFRRDAMKKPVKVSGISKTDMKPQKSMV